MPIQIARLRLKFEESGTQITVGKRSGRGVHYIVAAAQVSKLGKSVKEYRLARAAAIKTLVELPSK